MARPKHIILLRHGESEGNVNRAVQEHRPDYAYRLTRRGHQQAAEAGEKIRELIQGGGTCIQPAMFYCSPYWRTRQTLLHVQKSVKPWGVYEDARLREQEWGTRIQARKEDIQPERDHYGHFYYRIEHGESCADVYDRVSDFMNTLHRDFEKPDYPEASIIVCHGMTMRLFLMRWFHYTVEDFSVLANPENCGMYVLRRPDGHSKFELVTDPKRYPAVPSPYQFKGLNEEMPE